MRLVHIADLHIGKRLCEFSLLADQRHVLSQVVGLLRARAADALIVAGDLYDKSSPSAEAVALVDWFLSEVAATGVPAVVIPGNHDSAERVAYAAGLLSRQGLHVAPVFNGRIEPVELACEQGVARIWPIPFLRPATVRHFFPEAEVESYTDAMQVVVDARELDPSSINIAVAHQFVTAGGVSPELGGSEAVVGGLDNVDAGAFAGFDYVALGHIHRPQRVGSDAIRYAGSPLKYSFAEADDTKSATVVELRAPGAEPKIELVPLRPLHDLRRIRGPLDELISPEVVAAADAQDYLHVVLTDENPVIDAMARLRAVYPNVMGIEYDNSRSRAAGLGGQATPSAADEGDASPLELFCEFYELQNGTGPSEAQRALVAAELERIGVR